MQVLFILGTRPEVIKLAPVIQTFYRSGLINVKLCVTSQHQELLRDALSYFNLNPDFNLNIMTPNQSLSLLSSKLILSLSEILPTLNPNLVVVQGDTTSAFIGALSAYYHHIPIAHIEAGLRSFNPYSPFPEEMNRIMISSLAHYHFTPTIQAKKNLENQGIKKNVWVSGNTGIDSLISVQKDLDKNPDLYHHFFSCYNLKTRIVLITAHRRENFGSNFIQLCQAINKLCSLFPDISFVFPRHPNPYIQEQSDKHLLKKSNLILMPPLSYPYFIMLMKKSELILSDSGGIQEEAPVLGKPILITRDTTERNEGISDNAKLIGTDYTTIIKEVSLLLSQGKDYHHMAQIRFPYGKGNASQFILNTLKTQGIIHG